MKISKILLILLAFYIFTLYNNRIDRNQTFTDWISDLIDLLKPSTNNSVDMINIAIYSHNIGII